MHRRFHEVFQHCHMGEQVELLKNHPHPAGEPGRIIRITHVSLLVSTDHRLAVDQDRLGRTLGGGGVVLADLHLRAVGRGVGRSGLDHHDLGLAVVVHAELAARAVQKPGQVAQLEIVAAVDVVLFAFVDGSVHLQGLLGPSHLGCGACGKGRDR